MINLVNFLVHLAHKVHEAAMYFATSPRVSYAAHVADVDRFVHLVCEGNLIARSGVYFNPY